MRTSTVVWIIVLVLVVGGLLWWFYGQTPAPTPTGTNTEQQATTTSEQGSNAGVGVSASVSTAPMSATVTYSANGFSPATVTIAKGGTVTFVDQAGTPMWVASAPHPAHTGYDGTDRATHCAAGYTGPKPFDQCAQGNSFSFTFQKTGSFKYHNHANSAAYGTVVVQ